MAEEQMEFDIETSRDFHRPDEWTDEFVRALVSEASRKIARNEPLEPIHSLALERAYDWMVDAADRLVQAGAGIG